MATNDYVAFRLTLGLVFVLIGIGMAALFELGAASAAVTAASGGFVVGHVLGYRLGLERAKR